MNGQSKVYLQALATFVEIATKGTCYVQAQCALGAAQRSVDISQELCKIFPPAGSICSPCCDKRQYNDSCFWQELRLFYGMLRVRLVAIYRDYCLADEVEAQSHQHALERIGQFQQMAQEYLTRYVRDATSTTFEALSAR